MTAGRDEEIVRSLREFYDAFNRGDYDNAIGFAHPDVEYIPAAGQTPLHGTDQLRAWMEPSAFERQILEPEDITVAGDKVLMRVHSTIRGAGSGIEMEIDMWTVMTVDGNGLATRVETFFRHEEREARVAAGLPA